MAMDATPAPARQASWHEVLVVLVLRETVLVLVIETRHIINGPILDHLIGTFAGHLPTTARPSPVALFCTWLSRSAAGILEKEGFYGACQNTLHRERWFGARPASSFRPVFFIFLTVGVFCVLPYLLLLPTQICLRAAWGKQPRLNWRLAVCISMAVAVLITCPPSPYFLGLDRPIPPDKFATEVEYSLTIDALLKSQCFLINAALIATIVCFPLSAISTFATIRDRRRLAAIRSRDNDIG